MILSWWVKRDQHITEGKVQLQAPMAIAVLQSPVAGEEEGKEELDSTW
jgi:hypothetical protein